MIFIKKLGSRKNKTGENIASWGLFLCPACDKEVERQLGSGKRCMSCGCSHYLNNKGSTIHGESKTRLYGIWGNMKKRCLNPNNNPDYKNYGGRGISVCPEWLEYTNFRNWALNNGYKDNLQIDRTNNNGNYDPSNCMFVTCEINNQNKRNTRFCMNEIIELRKICKFGGYSQKRIGAAYNIGSGYLSNIINNKTWRNNEACQ